jgi:hypothetical protein
MSTKPGALHPLRGGALRAGWSPPNVLIQPAPSDEHRDRDAMPNDLLVGDQTVALEPLMP